MNVKHSLIELPSDLNKTNIPHHVAVIMDGNGRWAKHRGFPRVMGHQKGVDTLKDLLRCCDDWGIKVLTAYAFSTENWHRPHHEVEFLLALFERVLRRELEEMMRKNVKIRFIGDLDALPNSLQDEINHSMDKTRHNQGIEFNIATNYGSRQEILQACRAIALEVKKGTVNVEEINEDLFESYLYTKGLSYPDLLIRTSGEMRLSNFLLWQMAYGEIYVTNTLWPDFDRTEFHRALLSYQGRERRFGKVTEK